jgi:transcription antitermination factor NusG
MRGIEDFLPIYQARRRWCDRVKIVSLPLFFGYLFCKCEPRDFNIVRSVSGVVDIIGFGDGPVAIPELEIEAIKRLITSGIEASPCPFLKNGALVRIHRGPLEGMTGRLVSIKNQFKLVISVKMLNRSVSVEINPEVVEAV